MDLDWPCLPERALDQPRVAVLLCTFNGALYLKEQLDSIAAQTHQNIDIWVSDDGSKDETRNILDRAQAAWGPDRIKVIEGPQRGFARNFLFLACHPGIEADYFAFCDQDDIWLPNKLARALNYLGQPPDGTPALYGGATRLVDTQGKSLGVSSLVPHTLNFQNALVQNFASGNTMLFNRALRDQVKRAGNQLDIVSHDWWLYLVATALQGYVVFDQEPHNCYRQHKDNLIGANARPTERLNRLKAMSTGRLMGWLQQNCTCLRGLATQMPPKHVATLRLLDGIRQRTRLYRLGQIAAIKVRRQSRFETWLFKAAIVLAKRVD
jgi:hypothetical protein